MRKFNCFLSHVYTDMGINYKIIYYSYNRNDVLKWCYINKRRYAVCRFAKEYADPWTMLLYFNFILETNDLLKINTDFITVFARESRVNIRVLQRL